ncbi:MAG TPA: head protein [Myxococcaceae bacterium]|nr:head protein [Myxococcaceae bacterium]
MNSKKLDLESQELLGRLWEESQSPEEKERLQFARDALSFIFDIGLDDDFDDYRAGLDVNAPPLVIAAFSSREQADEWLRNHPHPPRHAKILVAGEYHYVWYSRKHNDRTIRRSETLEYYLAEMIRDGVPPPAFTFDTQEEANTWLHSQPEPPKQVFIQIAGELHLAAYHYRVNLRAIYPLSRAAKNVNWD